MPVIIVTSADVTIWKRLNGERRTVTVSVCVKDEVAAMLDGKDKFHPIMNKQLFKVAWFLHEDGRWAV